MKMRVLTATNKGKLISLAAKVAEKAESSYKVDQIPPAYPCERERLIVIVVSAKASMPETFNRFCGSRLSREMATNVALIVDGKPENASKIMHTIKNTGVNLIEDVLYVNGGLPFKFAKKYTPEEESAVIGWTERVLAQLK